MESRQGATRVGLRLEVRVAEKTRLRRIEIRPQREPEKVCASDAVARDSFGSLMPRARGNPGSVALLDVGRTAS